jgi:thiopurine S-methyltransferase
MEPQFWLERWQKREIGFHQPVPHRALDLYWDHLAVAKDARVFVPLAGKSLDLRWLAERGQRVVAVELAEAAVREFFADASLTPVASTQGKLLKLSAGAFDFYCGDFFDLEPKMLAGVTAVFDRAALIALPPPMRVAYSQRMGALLEQKAQMLLVTLEYDQLKLAGPPHSVAEPEVRSLYAGWQSCDRLERTDELARSPKFRERGLDALVESVYLCVR